jgi:hypothetical protein
VLGYEDLLGLVEGHNVKLADGMVEGSMLDVVDGLVLG